MRKKEKKTCNNNKAKVDNRVEKNGKFGGRGWIPRDGGVPLDMDTDNTSSSEEDWFL